MPQVTGTIINPTGAARPANVTFRPLYAAKVKGTALVTITEPQVATAYEDGTFAIDLEDGAYEVRIGSDLINITVPGTAGPHNLVDLIDP